MPGTTFNPGDTITVTVTATSSDDPVNVQVTLKLDDDADHSGSHYYDNALSGSLGNREAETFNFVVTLPRDVALGQHYYAIVFNDAHFVLRFEYSGWEKAYLVSGPS